MMTISSRLRRTNDDDDDDDDNNGDIIIIIIIINNNWYCTIIITLSNVLVGIGFVLMIIDYSDDAFIISTRMLLENY